jgi:hypothetical protein
MELNGRGKEPRRKIVMKKGRQNGADTSKNYRNTNKFVLAPAL